MESTTVGRLRHVTLLAVGLLIFVRGADVFAQRPVGVWIDARPIWAESLNTEALDGVTAVSSDGNTLYFASTRPWAEPGALEGNRLDTYVVTRGGPGEPFRDVRASVNTPVGDSATKISADELRLYSGSNRTTPESHGGWDVFVVSRDDPADEFTEDRVQNLGAQPEGPNSNEEESHPALSGDELTLVHQRFTGGGMDLVLMTREAIGGPFMTSPAHDAAFAAVNTERDEAVPSLSTDGRAVFFSEWTILFGPPGAVPARPGGFGYDDLWITWRDSIGDLEEPAPFGPPENLGPPLSTPYRELIPVISYDWPDAGAVMYFASDRPHPLSGGSMDAFQATWLPGEEGADVVFEEEAPLEKGAINCGGFDVDATAEIGVRFERDRFIGDDIAWGGSDQDGFVVTSAAFGHAESDTVRARRNPREVDLEAIENAGQVTARIFSRGVTSTDKVHYQARVVPGRYEVTLYFAEDALEATYEPGQGPRLIDVSLAGDKVLCRWSAAAAAGDPGAACGAVLDRAISRRFVVDVSDGENDDNVGTLDIVVEPSDGTGLLAEATLSAFYFRQADGAADEAVAVPALCEPDDDGREAIVAAKLAEARDRWATRGELFINCGGPMLACGTTQNPAPGAIDGIDAGAEVVWIGDTHADGTEQEGEFFGVRVLDDFQNVEELATLASDMGPFDARGTTKGVDGNDRIFHTARTGSVEYDIYAEDGEYEVTLFFANASIWTSGTASSLFQIAVERDRQIGDDNLSDFPHCDPALDFRDLYDPVDHAEQLYAPVDCDPCEDCRCEPNGVIWDYDLDQDGIPATEECGNAAATALVYTTSVGGGSLTVAIEEPDPLADPVDALGRARPTISGIRVRRLGVELRFVRGDVDGDLKPNIADAVALLVHLFQGAEVDCRAALNTNGDDAVNITDASYLLNFLFGGGAQPVAPYPECGPGMLDADPVLGCENPPNC